MARTQKLDKFSLSTACRATESRWRSRTIRLFGVNLECGCRSLVQPCHDSRLPIGRFEVPRSSEYPLNDVQPKTSGGDCSAHRRSFSCSLRRRSLLARFLGVLGPGLITGAADDDPSRIATYSVAGAQFGTSLLWTALLTRASDGRMRGVHTFTSNASFVSRTSQARRPRLAAYSAHHQCNVRFRTRPRTTNAAIYAQAAVSAMSARSAPL